MKEYHETRKQLSFGSASRFIGSNLPEKYCERVATQRKPELIMRVPDIPKYSESFVSRDLVNRSRLNIKRVFEAITNHCGVNKHLFDIGCKENLSNITTFLERTNRLQ